MQQKTFTFETHAQNLKMQHQMRFEMIFILTHYTGHIIQYDMGISDPFAKTDIET